MSRVGRSETGSRSRRSFTNPSPTNPSRRSPASELRFGSAAGERRAVRG